MTATTSASVADFIRERCLVGLKYSCRFVNLRGAFILWCLHNRLPHGDNVEGWELAVQRAVPELHVLVDADGSDGFAYVGLALKT